jgi:PAS domain S-box-containing protein
MVDKGNPESGQPERSGLLGDLANKLQEGLRATVEALRQSHAQRLAAIVESSDDGIISVDLESTIATWNAGAERLFGYSAEEIVGEPLAILFSKDPDGEDLQIVERIRLGELIGQYKAQRRRKDGKLVDVSLSVSPIKDATGGIIGASKIARDITAQERVQKSQAAHYQFTDRLFRAGSLDDIYDAALDAIIRALDCKRASILMFDDAGVMKFVAWRGLSDGYRKAVEGYSPWKRETRDPEPALVEDIDAADLEPALKATIKSEGVGALAFIPLTTKGRVIGKFMTYYEGAHKFTDSEMELAVTIARQFGFSIERLRAEEGKQLLLEESAHRVKNTLATVQAIAAQTLSDAKPANLEVFRARLRALAEAHDLLTSENWHRAPLGEVVRRALKPFGNRFIIQGSEVYVPAQASLLLTMCLHELATNAAKYGALSNGTGNVHVSWIVGGEGSLLTWLEVGGPLVTAPQRKGFGSLLIEQTFRGEQQSCFDYRPTGLICVLALGELPMLSL